MSDINSANLSHYTKKQFYKSASLIILAAAVCVAVLAVHWPVLSAEAISLDDDQYLKGNMLVQNPSWASAEQFLTEILEPSTVDGYYQPLAMISLMTDCALGAGVDNLMPFHRTSLVLHAANTVLVIMLLYLLFGRVWAAIGVGLLFGLHPMTVETIAWVSERKTLVAAFFAFLSLNLYVGYARRGSLRFYAACLLAFVLALMSKPITVPLPAVMLLFDYWPLNRIKNLEFRIKNEKPEGKILNSQFSILNLFLEKLPFFILAIAGAIIAYISQNRTAGTTPPTEYGLAHIPLILCHNIVFYPYKILWPVNLSSYYPFPSPFVLSQPMVAAGVIGTGILIPLLILTLRWTRAALTGWLIFFIAALPTMQIIGFSNVIASDKFAYIPSIGLLLILTAFLRWFISRGRVSLRCLLVLIIVLASAGAEAAATRTYLSHWRNTLTLTDYMLKLTPGAHQLLNLRAYVYQREGDLDEAVRNYRQVIERMPNYVEAHNNLALVLKLQGKLSEAVDEYRKAEQIEPNNATIQYNLGNALQSLGNLDEAISHYNRALKIKPRNIQTQLNLANALAAQGKYDEALDRYRKILNVRPLEAIILNDIGLTLQKQDKFDEAIDYYTKSLRIKPDFSEAHYNLIYALALQNRLDEAIDYYRQVLHVNLEDAEAYNLFGVAFQSRNESDKAIEQFRKALQAKPDFVEAYKNLALSFESQGNNDEAIAQYRKALEFKPDDVELHMKAGILLASQDNLDKAILHFAQAVRLEPDSAEAHYNMGVALAMTDKPREAIEHLKQALQLKPSWYEPAIWWARILAANPDSKVRDPNSAVIISLKAAELTKYQAPEVLEVLAVSYAAAGRFEEALRTAQQALALAEAGQNNELANLLRDMIEQYKNQGVLKPVDK